MSKRPLGPDEVCRYKKYFVQLIYLDFWVFFLHILSEWRVKQFCLKRSSTSDVFPVGSSLLQMYGLISKLVLAQTGEETLCCSGLKCTWIHFPVTTCLMFEHMICRILFKYIQHSVPQNKCSHSTSCLFHSLDPMLKEPLGADVTQLLTVCADCCGSLAASTGRLRRVISH